MITRVFDDSPAAEAGIRAGDRLVSVDGKPVTGAALDSAVVADPRAQGHDRAAGHRPPATGRRASCELERERIRVPAVDVAGRDGRRREDRLPAAGAVHQGLGRRRCATPSSALREKGATALVLDLRGDPGGLVNEAVGVAGVFLPDGTPVVVTEGLHSPRRDLPHRAATRPPATCRWSCSSTAAAPAPARSWPGALRDADRAELVGERTFGKALVQSTRPLRDGGRPEADHRPLPHARRLRPGQARPAARREGRRRPRDRRADEALQRGLALAAAAAMSRGRPGGGPGLRAGARRPRRGGPAGLRARAARSRSPRARAAAPRSATWSSVTHARPRRPGDRGPRPVVARRAPPSPGCSPPRAWRGPSRAPPCARPTRPTTRAVAGRPRPPRPARPARHHHRPRGRQGPRRRDRRRARARRGDAAVGAHRRRVALRAGGRARSTARPRGAATRSTSPAPVVPMLPERLSSDLCSLRPGVDRAAVTVEMVDRRRRGRGRDALLALADPLRAAPDLPRGRRAAGRRRARRRGPRGRHPPRRRASPRRCASAGWRAGRSRPSRPSRSCASTATGWPRSASRARPRPTRWWRSA